MFDWFSRWITKENITLFIAIAGFVMSFMAVSAAESRFLSAFFAIAYTGNAKNICMRILPLKIVHNFRLQSLAYRF